MHRAVGRGSALQRVGERPAAGGLDPRGPGGLSGDLRGHPGGRRQPGRHLGPHRAGGGGAPARPRPPARPERRPDRGDDGGIRPRPRSGRREPGWRPAERSARHPDAGRQAGRRVRPRLRLAAAPAGQADPAQGAVVGRQPADPPAHRRADHRQRLLAQGLPAGPAGPDLALRRAAPVHSRALGERRARGSPSCRCGTTPGGSARASTASAEP